jgi:hypothetical protein
MIRHCGHGTHLVPHGTGRLVTGKFGVGGNRVPFDTL